MELFKNSKLNIYKITFINITITFSFSNYRKWAKNFFIEKVNINNWNLETIIHFFPILIGFFQMIYLRYKDQTFLYFFEKNIPGKKILKDEISWETFHYIQSFHYKKNQIKNIDIYNDFFLLDIKDNNQNYFIGLIPINENKKNPTSFYKIPLKNILNLSTINPNKTDFLSGKIFYKLDELPFKLEISYETDSSKFSFFDNELKKINENFYFPRTKKSYNTNFLKIPKNFENDFSSSPVKVFAAKVSSKNINFIDNIEITKYPKKSIIQKELNFLFYNHELLPYFKNTNTKFLIIDNDNKSNHGFMFKEFSTKETLTIVNEFLPLNRNNQLKVRKISGYLYPDLEKKKIYSFLVKQIINYPNNNLFLKINLPSSFSYFLNNNSFYPSILTTNSRITNRKDGFFGFNIEETAAEKQEKFIDTNWKKSIFNEINKKEKYEFDELDDSDPDSWFLLYNFQEKKKAYFFEQNIINFELNGQKEKFFPPQNLTSTKLNYHFNAFTENLINNNFYNPLHSGEIYRRTINLSNFLNNKNFSDKINTFNFVDCWEPISVYSWMIIIQFSVGIFLLQLLKDLYKDYGKELVEYVLQFASSSGIDVEELKEQYLYEDPGYRLIKKIRKKFKDVAGIDNILPELGEIVWFLRNFGRSSKFKNSIPKGILLTGPPGTGKTLLVQAIAGEAQVPVIIESGSLLTDPQQKGRGIEKLKKIFEQARELSPCIVFIDEVDTIGEKRQNIIQTAMGGDELIESIYENKTNELKNSFIPQPLNLHEQASEEKDLEYQLFRNQSENPLSNQFGQIQKTLETKKTQLSLLTQFLIEMDGLKERNGVIVIGATNRPAVLDPALIRPGRFDKILNLELPGKTKRIEILKLYSKKLEIEKNVSWNYLANRTKGFSAADLAAAMNESAIQSILQKTTHTIETIERGIDLVTSYNLTNPISNQKQKNKDPFFINRLAYYQAGKAIIQTIFSSHDPVVVLYLQPRQKNARHAKFYEKYFAKNKNRLQVENELISLYAGKAAEIFALSGQKTIKSLKRWQSDLGLDDLLSASFLSNLMVDNWFLYSTKLVTRKMNPILNDQNSKEFQEYEKLDLLTIFENQVEDEVEIEQIAKLCRLNNYQQKGFGPWWQIQVSKQLAEIDSFFADWYRIYLPDPEESLLNLEWIPPDEFYHNNDSLKTLSPTSLISFNELYKIERDYIFHGLILNAFNKAFSNLETTREFLDYFADYLIRYDILRQEQIQYICKQKKSEKKNPAIEFNTFKIFNKEWGKNSRRENYRFINFDFLNYAKKLTKYKSPFNQI
jgi:ATP-dependent Zn protease